MRELKRERKDRTRNSGSSGAERKKVRKYTKRIQKERRKEVGKRARIREGGEGER